MDLRNLFFKFRSYTPLPLVLVLLYFSKPYQPLLNYGLALITIGELIRIWAVRYAGGVTRTRNVGAPELCTSGPFAYVRNPLYIGNIIIYSGVVLIAGGDNVWLMLGITILFFLVQYSLIVSLEQNTLADLFGKQYNDYCQNVRALLPRLTPWASGKHQQPLNFRDIFIPEKSTLLNIILIFILLFARTYLPAA